MSDYYPFLTNPDSVIIPKSTNKASDALQHKFAHWYHLKTTSGLSFNEKLFANKSFKNPKLHEKLLDFLGVDQHGSNKSYLSAKDLPPFYNYKELVKMHQVYTEEKQKMIATDRSRNDKSQIPQIPFKCVNRQVILISFVGDQMV
ncbi:hypothetical protein ROZALSC1DRAFT_30414 [Rozella allomycis CSF55]|uniref:Uncharacterized protein n=1 Tax=Rozella allomycis (strain CSF55) TaxID=988480 RepID=A0A4P9YEL5_ROZAC|nr:hypothetical protein ROZALSC1DRAFT_30414 [Rozella allomycis CSF55]